MNAPTRTRIFLSGDVNLVGTENPATPFEQVADMIAGADFAFCNLECCLHDTARDADGRAIEEGYFAAPGPAGDALRLAGFKAVGLANNVVLGSQPILDTVERLDALDILHTGAGRDAETAAAPVVVEVAGVRVGIVQRTAVYWPSNHEAKAGMPGVAAMRGNTAYQAPLHKTRPGMTACNRPGLPPLVVTWVDPPYLKSLKEDIAALRARCDFVVMSCHWGWKKDVLDYMREWAFAAIDAGADLVLGHGPHDILPVEMHAGKPIFYGLGNFSFNIRADGSKMGDWLGSCLRIELEGKRLARAACRFVRHDELNRTVLRTPTQEAEARDAWVRNSLALGARLEQLGDELELALS